MCCVAFRSFVRSFAGFDMQFVCGFVAFNFNLFISTTAVATSANGASTTTTCCLYIDVSDVQRQLKFDWQVWWLSCVGCCNFNNSNNENK